MISGCDNVEKMINNMTIHYEEKGEGKAVFILHGWGANAEVYRSITDTLATQYHVVAFDFPGFGGSTEPSEPWSVDDFTRLAIDFIASFGEEEVILIGHSFGGRVIIKMTTVFDIPFTVSKIILVDSAGIMPKRSAKAKAKVKLYKTGKAVLSFPVMKMLYPDALDQLRSRMGSADYNAASPVMRASLVKTVNEDLTDLLEKVQPETLLIWGDADTATPLADGQLMEQKIKGSGLVVLKGAGHFSFLDQPAIFQSVIKSFLNIEA